MNNWRVSSFSTINGQCIEVGDWRKPSGSLPAGACIEVSSGIAVRDSKNRSGETLRFTPDAWRAFVAGLRGWPLLP